MSRRLLVAGNWKMNLSLSEAGDLARSVAGAASSSVDVAVFPSFPWIVPVRDVAASSGVLIGAQNCSAETFGAFTGEVSAVQLADVCHYILAGHSERRHVFGESDELVGRKVAAILSAGVRPVLCVGETLDERREEQAQAVVDRQLRAGLTSVEEDALDRITIAYEPVWAIGTGVAATAEDAQEMCGFIRTWLDDRFGPRGRDVRILYGGSVTPDNAEPLFSQADIDGGLVGGASLKAASFGAIILAAQRLD